MDKSWLTTLDAAYGRFLTFLGYVAGISIGLFAVSIVLDLVMRRLGLGNIPWLNEMIEYVLYASVFLAAPWVLRQGAHVRVDVLVTALPKALAARIDRALDFVGAVISGALCYYGLMATIETYVGQARQYKTLTIYSWWLMTIFTFATGLLVIEFLFRMRRGAEPGEVEEAAGTSGF